MNWTIEHGPPGSHDAHVAALDGGKSLRVYLSIAKRFPWVWLHCHPEKGVTKQGREDTLEAAKAAAEKYSRRTKP
jgi:hypothetical protein